MKFIQFVFSFKGRIGRQTFWLANILMIIGFVVSSALLQSVETEPYGFVAMLALLWLFFPVTVKRWHDRNKSGFWMLINLIPWIGQIWTFIELGFLPGTKGQNRFDCEERGASDDGSSKKSEEQGPDQNAEKFNYLYGDLVSMLAKMAKADGRITQGEIQTVDRLFSELFVEPEKRNEAISVFRKSKDSVITFEEHARAFASKHAQNRSFLSMTVDALFYLSISDGGMSAEEELLLNTAESILGVRSAHYSKYREDARSSGASKEVKDVAYYTKILGLSCSASKDEVRTRYKELVRQYHPDKVAHLGDRLKEVAHEEIQRINEAYEYLKNAYEV